MRSIIQRVRSAKVEVEGEVVGSIGPGILALVGFEADETNEDFEYISRKISQMRIFNDAEGVMNLSVQDVGGSVLLVSQFTLHAQTKKGNRPSYIKSAPPEMGKTHYDAFVEAFTSSFDGKVETGEFGADMQVSLVNDGPVTLMLDSKNRTF